MLVTHRCGVIACFLAENLELIAEVRAFATCVGMSRSVRQNSTKRLQRRDGPPYVLPPTPSDIREELVSLSESDER